MSKKSTVVVPEVVEDEKSKSKFEVEQRNDTSIVNLQPSTSNLQFGLTAANVYDKIGHQINVVKFMELRSNFEKLRLGAMVREAVNFLGIESQGGRGHEGEGVKGWWERHFKDADGKPVIEYRQLMRWVQAAEALPKYLNAIGAGCGKSEAQIKKVLSKNPGKKFKKDELKLLASAEKAANEVTMKQLLLFGGEEDARGKRGKPGRPKGTGAGEVTYKKKSTMEVAVAEVWPVVQHFLKHRAAMFTAYKILPDEKLTEFRDTLTEHVKAIEAVLDARKE